MLVIFTIFYLFRKSNHIHPNPLRIANIYICAQKWIKIHQEPILQTPIERYIAPKTIIYTRWANCNSAIPFSYTIHGRYRETEWVIVHCTFAYVYKKWKIGTFPYINARQLPSNNELNCERSDLFESQYLNRIRIWLLCFSGAQTVLPICKSFCYLKHWTIWKSLQTKQFGFFFVFFLEFLNFAYKVEFETIKRQ